MFPSILIFDLTKFFCSFWTLWGPNGLLLGSVQSSKTVFGSTHVDEQLSFSLFLSILTFTFDLILGSFFTFQGPYELFLGSGWFLKTVLGSTHVVQQLSFSILPPILTFDFDLIFGSFLTFWGCRRVQKLFSGLLMQLNNFNFLCYIQF